MCRYNGVYWRPDCHFAHECELSRAQGMAKRWQSLVDGARVGPLSAGFQTEHAVGVKCDEYDDEDIQPCSTDREWVDAFASLQADLASQNERVQASL